LVYEYRIGFGLGLHGMVFYEGMGVGAMGG